MISFLELAGATLFQEFGNRHRDLVLGALHLDTGQPLRHREVVEVRYGSFCLEKRGQRLRLSSVSSLLLLARRGCEWARCHPNFTLVCLSHSDFFGLFLSLKTACLVSRGRVLAARGRRHARLLLLAQLLELLQLFDGSGRLLVALYKVRAVDFNLAGINDLVCAT